MAFFHGVRAEQAPTAITPSITPNAAIPMYWGCAPIHRLSPEEREKVMPGEITLIFTIAEAGQRLGISTMYDDFEKWDLSESAYNQFTVKSRAPALFANLFDPDIHFQTVTDETVELINGKGQLANKDVYDDLVLTYGLGADLQPGVDYHLNRITGEITALDGGAMTSLLAVSATYSYAAPEMVTMLEAIGGYDIVTGKTTGLELVNRAFPKYRLFPGVLAAPRFGEDPTVAALLAAKSQNINSVFDAVAVADIPSDGVNGITRYTDVPGYKNDNSLVSPDLYLCWPKIAQGERRMRPSSQLAGILADIDAAHFDIPYVSPSNENLVCNSATAGGEAVWLDIQQANYLNSNGIATPLNFIGGWKLWGNRTACYPGNVDPKDTFFSSRRMLAWYNNRLILTYWSRVDFPLNRRFIQTILNSEQIIINSLVAVGAITGGRIEFDEGENPITDLMDGIVKFHIYLGLVAPAEDIRFTLEYDPMYLQNLFAA
jgi:phage tail sheath protein FI